MGEAAFVYLSEWSAWADFAVVQVRVKRCGGLEAGCMARRQHVSSTVPSVPKTIMARIWFCQGVVSSVLDLQ